MKRQNCAVIGTLVLSLAGIAQAADPIPNPLVATSKGIYQIAKSDILRSAEKMPEENLKFQPTPDVRTFGQLLGHVADAQYEFCGAVAEGKPVTKGFEKSATTRAELVAALKEAFAYCDAVYAKMTDADAAVVIPFFGFKATKLGIMDFNVAHTMEHYGNMVTYMRIKGVVPPSSEPQK